MPGKMRVCDGCHKIMRSDNIKRHKQTCRALRNNEEGDASGDSQTTTIKSETRPKKSRKGCQGCGKTYAHRQSLYKHNKYCQASRNNKGDGSGVNVKDSQTTTIKSETTGQIVGKKNYHRKVYCRECGIPMGSNNISRHEQYYCQVLRNRKNERAKKRKVDYLEDSKDIPTFEESEFSGLKSLPSEALIRIMELLKNNVENQIHILKLGNRFYSNTKVYCQKCGKTYSSRQSLWNHKKYCKGGNVNTLHSILSQVESRVKETDLTSNISEIGANKRKVDCLGESKDISSFEEPELSGTKSLPSETLVEMIKDS